LPAAEESKEYQDQKKELEQLTASRDLDLYEMAFVPMVLDDIVLRDRLGNERAFTYLTFRLRNHVPVGSRLEDDMPRSAEMLKVMAGPAQPPVAQPLPPRYAEVLKNIADQYPNAKVTTEGGGRVVIGDDKDPSNIVLERQDMAVKERTVAVTLTAFDEHGSRIQLLDEPVGSGKQNEFPVDDRGNIRNDIILDTVRERIEELADRRLRTLREMREMKLPSYDATKRDAEGVAEGEVFGVAIFDRFNLRGTRFTIEVRGLCNKTRVTVPAAEEGKPENWLAMRVLRRSMVLEYRRPGDEFYRETDRYILQDARYRWLDTFQRLDTRQTMSLTKYYFDNIQGRDNKLQTAVEQDFWRWYGKIRAERPNAGDKLPDLEASLKSGQ
jgi:hypothetical protein